MLQNIVKKSGLWMITLIVFTGSGNFLWSYISIFEKSIPNQAGVSYDITFDNWDYLIAPAYYSQLKNDSLEAGYTNFTGEKNTILLGGRFTLGLPIYTAVSYKNNPTQKENSNTTSETKKQIIEDMHLRASVGILVGESLGVGIFTQMKQMAPDEASDLKYNHFSYTNPNAGDGQISSFEYDYHNPDDITQIGINAGGQFGRLVASLGMAYLVEGGENEMTVKINGGSHRIINNAGKYAPIPMNLPASLGGSEVSYPTDADGNALKAPQAIGDKPSGVMYMNAQTIGWLQYGSGDNVGWYGGAKIPVGTTDYSFDELFQRDCGGQPSCTVVAPVGSKEVTKNTYTGVEDGNLYIFSTQAFKVGKSGMFYVTPELGAIVNHTEWVRTPDTGNKSTIKFQNYAVAAGLPLVFQIAVHPQLDLFAGTYPKLKYSIHDRRIEKTEPVSGSGATNTNTTSETPSTLVSSLEDYGLGFQYKPDKNFHINLLFNKDDETGFKGVSLTAYYLFEAVKAGEEGTATEDKTSRIKMIEETNKAEEAKKQN